MHFLLASSVVRLVDNEAFMKLLDESPFKLIYAPLDRRRSQDVGWFKSFRVAWVPYSFAEGSVDQDEAFTVLRQNSSTDGVF